MANGYYYDEKKESLFYLLLHVLFLLNTIGALLDPLIYMYVITLISSIYFVIIRLGAVALFVVLQQLILLLLAGSLFATVKLELPEFCVTPASVL